MTVINEIDILPAARYHARPRRCQTRRAWRSEIASPISHAIFYAKFSNTTRSIQSLFGEHDLFGIRAGISATCGRRSDGRCPTSGDAAVGIELATWAASFPVHRTVTGSMSAGGGANWRWPRLDDGVSRGSKQEMILPGSSGDVVDAHQGAQRSGSRKLRAWT